MACVIFLLAGCSDDPAPSPASDVRIVGSFNAGDYEGGKISALSLNPKDNQLFAVTGAYGTWSIYDTASESLTYLSKPPVFKRPTEVAFSESTGFVYVSDSDANTVYFMNPSVPSVVGNVALARPADIVVHHDSGDVYVRSLEDRKVWVIRGGSSPSAELVTEIPEAKNLIASPRGDRLYAAHADGDGVSLFDPASKSVQELPLTNVGWLAMDDQRNELYVQHPKQNIIDVVDADSGDSRRSITVDEAPGRVAVDSSSGVGYVLGVDSKSVMILDGSRQTKMIPIGHGEEFSSLEVDEQHDRVYISSVGGRGTIYVVGI